MLYLMMYFAVFKRYRFLGIFRFATLLETMFIPGIVENLRRRLGVDEGVKVMQKERAHLSTALYFLTPK